MITVPTEGRPSKAPDSSSLEGLDGNAFNIMGATRKLLRDAGASPEFLAAYTREATSGDYDHVLQTSIAYLDAEAAPAGREYMHHLNRQAATAQGADPDTICPYCGEDLETGHLPPERELHLRRVGQ